MKYTERELCAIVITKAIRNDVQPMVHFIQELRRQGYDDLDVGRLFTETAMIIFGETWPEDEPQFCKHEYCVGEEHCIYSLQTEENNEEASDQWREGQDSLRDSDQNLPGTITDSPL